MVSTTVILTTFDRKDSLEKTLASLDNQTNKNFEINIVDDFSTDGTKHFCEEYVFNSIIPSRYIRFEKKDVILL